MSACGMLTLTLTLALALALNLTIAILGATLDERVRYARFVLV